MLEMQQPVSNNPFVSAADAARVPEPWATSATPPGQGATDNRPTAQQLASPHAPSLLQQQHEQLLAAVHSARQQQSMYRTALAAAGPSAPTGRIPGSLQGSMPATPPNELASGYASLNTGLTAAALGWGDPNARLHTMLADAVVDKFKEHPAPSPPPEPRAGGIAAAPAGPHVGSTVFGSSTGPHGGGTGSTAQRTGSLGRAEDSSEGAAFSTVGPTGGTDGWELVGSPHTEGIGSVGPSGGIAHDGFSSASGRGMVGAGGLENVGSDPVDVSREDLQGAGRGGLTGGSGSYNSRYSMGGGSVDYGEGGGQSSLDEGQVAVFEEMLALKLQLNDLDAENSALKRQLQQQRALMAQMQQTLLNAGPASPPATPTAATAATTHPSAPAAAADVPATPLISQPAAVGMPTLGAGAGITGTPGVAAIPATAGGDAPSPLPGIPPPPPQSALSASIHLMSAVVPPPSQQAGAPMTTGTVTGAGVGNGMGAREWGAPTPLRGESVLHTVPLAIPVQLPPVPPSTSATPAHSAVQGTMTGGATGGMSPFAGGTNAGGGATPVQAQPQQPLVLPPDAFDDLISATRSPFAAAAASAAGRGSARVSGSGQGAAAGQAGGGGGQQQQARDSSSGLSSRTPSDGAMAAILAVEEYERAAATSGTSSSAFQAAGPRSDRPGQGSEGFGGYAGGTTAVPASSLVPPPGAGPYPLIPPPPAAPGGGYTGGYTPYPHHPPPHPHPHHPYPPYGPPHPHPHQPPPHYHSAFPPSASAAATAAARSGPTSSPAFAGGNVTGGGSIHGRSSSVMLPPLGSASQYPGLSGTPPTRASYPPPAGAGPWPGSTVLVPPPGPPPPYWMPHGGTPGGMPPGPPPQPQPSSYGMPPQQPGAGGGGAGYSYNQGGAAIAPAGRSGGATAGDTGGGPHGPWSCAACTYRHEDAEALYLRCAMCGALK